MEIELWEKGLNMKTLYPLADPDLDGWHADGDYLVRGASLQWINPQKFIEQVRQLDIDEISRENIEDLKLHILQGGKLDPLKIDHLNNREDGRHRAHAAVELGIALVPVLIFKK